LTLQALSTRFVLNQKWWLTYAGVLSAAYLYLRPLIRRRLGSAEQGYINFYSVYIAWLCSAVFLHLPSVGRLGVDFKADLSILLTTFLVSHDLCAACMHMFGPLTCPSLWSNCAPTERIFLAGNPRGCGHCTRAAWLGGDSAHYGAIAIQPVSGQAGDCIDCAAQQRHSGGRLQVGYFRPLRLHFLIVEILW
jgi:hypothetical protein